MENSDGSPPGGDNSESNPSGATVTETGRPVVVVGGLRVVGREDRCDDCTDARLRPRNPAVACDACAAAVVRQLGPRLRAGALSVALSGRYHEVIKAREAAADRQLSVAAERIVRRNARKAERAATAAAQSSDPPTEPLRRKAHGRREGVLGLLDALENAA